MGHPMRTIAAPDHARIKRFALSPASFAKRQMAAWVERTVVVTMTWEN